MKSIIFLFFFQDLWDIGGWGWVTYPKVCSSRTCRYTRPWIKSEQFKAVKKEKACIHLWGKIIIIKKDVLHSLKIKGQTFHQEFLTKACDSVPDLSPSSTGLWSE